MNKKNKINANTNNKITKLLRDSNIFNPTLRTFSNFESGLEFQKLLYSTKFLVPLISNTKHIGGKMLYINNEYKTKFYLIFTDFSEINRCFKKEKYQYFETTLDRVSKIAQKNNALIILNWKTDNYILTEDMLKNLFNKENINDSIKHEKKKLYSQAFNIYPSFSNLLFNLFLENKNITKAYFLKSNTTNKFLIILDTEKENLPNISNEINKLIRKEKLEINITLSTRINSYKNYSEFYNKEIKFTYEKHA